MNRERWYAKDLEDVEQTLDSNLETGLAKNKAKKRLEKYGKNDLKEKKKEGLLKKFINQFKDFMVIILIIAAAISGVLGEVTDTIIIFIIVFLNAILGLVQENKAEKSLEALKSMSTPNSKVLRDGSIMEVKSYNIVPGDIVLLEAGDYVPADGRIIEKASLQVEESALTGESLPVNKTVDTLADKKIVIGDRKNMVFSGSVVTHGRGKFIVTSTGMNTEIGKIATMLESQEKGDTPLQRKLAELGKKLGIIALIICAIIFLVGFFQGRPIFDMFMISVSLAVAAIPEGLPAIVTIVLSLGVQRMIKKNAIIRRLPAVETLGTASIICSDKTGTLTQNKMTVTKAYTYDKLIDVDEIDINDNEYRMLVYTGVLCNDASIEENDGEKKTIGDPTEIALVALGYEKEQLKKTLESEFKRVEEIPFDSDRKMMSTIHEVDGGYRVFTKGAIDVLINRCNKILINDNVESLNEEKKSEILEENKNLAKEGLRVLALAYKDISDIPNEVSSKNIENDLVFIGMTAMIDPPRETVKGAVERCKTSGIRPIMITGDYKITAISIAKELGIIQSEEESIDGEALEDMTDDELKENIEKYSVYARVSPEHKVRIVKAWQDKGKIVAMTGDGVNDAPSLKRSDIGCAMGITGTDVSKEASDMILTDDNFSTIVSAVEEGRVIYDNIRKSIHYLLSCNIGEIVALLTALLFNLPAPLIPIHILWINLVTDSFPALSLGVDPGEKDIMERKPRKPRESIFAHGLGLSIVIRGIMIGIVSFSAFNVGLNEDIITGRTMAFLVLSISQFANSLSVRSLDKNIFKIGILSNKYLLMAISLSGVLMLSVTLVPFLQNIFELGNLSLEQWLMVVGFSIIPFSVAEIYKTIRNRMRK
ncbi:calcium-transporting P-type ATPase, PMR1-type [Dethiothermospora halolimnae]|uniref:calcium-transporting P-type ATPase, PMR1-type n=1 Tax=Dethiothermospora halolimnae TaxID=3114390 RepID=UPI003CCC2EF4